MTIVSCQGSSFCVKNVSYSFIYSRRRYFQSLPRPPCRCELRERNCSNFSHAKTRRRQGCGDSTKPGYTLIPIDLFREVPSCSLLFAPCSLFIIPCSSPGKFGDCHHYATNKNNKPQRSQRNTELLFLIHQLFSVKLCVLCG